MRKSLFLVSICCSLTVAAEPRTNLKLEFGPNKVTPAAVYSKEAGYGFEPGSDAKESAGCVAGDKPFLFSAALPEGNYKVSVTLGDQNAESVTTVKAEMRRLMLEKVHADAGKTETRTFTVNIRTPEISTGGEVKLKDREKQTEVMQWDEKLTLEFDGQHPALAAIDISKADDLPTVYILGDSTVCDQPREPWNSWGQMLTRFFKPDVVVANNAESGESLKSSLGARRLDKVLSTMKAGDYLFIQFGHNDMKDKAADAVETYKKNLKHFVDAAKGKGATAVIVTSMERKGGVEHDTLGEYPESARQVAKEEGVTLIDLNAMSRTFYKALGGDIGKAFQDGTHHNNYGSYELAQCIVQGIKESKLPLAGSIVDDFKGFDPAKPDALASFAMPASPMHDAAKPDGN